MKIQMYEDGGLGIVNFSTAGVKMVGFLIPSNDDYDDLFLIRKSQADAAFTNMNVQTITTGTLSLDTIKNTFSGDVSLTPSDTVVLKSTIGIGTFTKVTVNAKGLVTLGSILAAEDIPNFGWEKITDQPTTAGGYGISDALLNTGGSISGNITLSTEPTIDTHAATMAYVQAGMQQVLANSIVTGDMFYKPVSPVPTGYLRCNGGYLLKTAYAALYSTLGSAFNHPTDQTLFSLPDLSSLESQGFVTFIKT